MCLSFRQSVKEFVLVILALIISASVAFSPTVAVISFLPTWHVAILIAFMAGIIMFLLIYYRLLDKIDKNLNVLSISNDPDLSY